MKTCAACKTPKQCMAMNKCLAKTGKGLKENPVYKAGGGKILTCN
jgi:hypothetical protein